MKQEKWGGMFVDIDRNTSIPNGSIIKVIAQELPEAMVMILIYWPIEATVFFFFQCSYKYTTTERHP